MLLFANELDRFLVQRLGRLPETASSCYQAYHRRSVRPNCAGPQGADGSVSSRPPCAGVLLSPPHAGARVPADSVCPVRRCRTEPRFWVSQRTRRARRSARRHGTLGRRSVRGDQRSGARFRVDSGSSRRGSIQNLITNHVYATAPSDPLATSRSGNGAPFDRFRRPPRAAQRTIPTEVS